VDSLLVRRKLHRFGVHANHSLARDSLRTHFSAPNENSAGLKFSKDLPQGAEKAKIARAKPSSSP
jgi:hypothetical protein